MDSVRKIDSFYALGTLSDSPMAAMPVVSRPLAEVKDKDAVADVLERAAEVIRQGWVQGSLTNYQGSYCAIGSIQHVVSETQIPYSISDQARAAFARYLGTAYRMNVIEDYHVVVPEPVEIWDVLSTYAPSVSDNRLETKRRWVDVEVDGIPQWNDAVGRTQEEVVEAMLNCAKDMRNAS